MFFLVIGIHGIFVNVASQLLNLHMIIYIINLHNSFSSGTVFNDSKTVFNDSKYIKYIKYERG